MEKKLFSIILIVFSIMSYSQIGISTSTPKATLDVMGKATDINAIDGIIAPRLTGNQLKAKDNLYGADQTGAMVYATSAASPVSTKTQNVTAVGYYYFDGSVWTTLKSASSVINDATRHLGGTVYTKFQQQSGGTLNVSKVIGGSENTNYQVGTVSNILSKIGGISSIVGNGYTISNPQTGIYDIKFDIPLTQIYAISVNILDAYGATSGMPTGQAPDSTQPGMQENTIDNSQVSYISNSIIRIKTGNMSGTLSNRTFTFLVTGQ